jgi:PAS domain S-box-containing protein
MSNKYLHHKNPKIAEQILSTALSAGNMGTWYFDVKNGFFDFTEEFYNIFKTNTVEMGDRKMTPDEYSKRFIPEEFRYIVKEEINQALNSKDSNYRNSIKHPVFFADGSEGFIKVSFQIIRDDNGEIIYLTGVNQDITHQELLDQKLKKQKDDLFESNNRIKTLVGHISHDLRNPLSNIKGLSEVLLNENDSFDKKIIELINSESDKALNLISNVLDNSIIRLGKINLEKELVPISNILSNSINRSINIFQVHRKQFKTQINKNFESEVDPNRIEQVFDNLLSNAIKYSPDKSEINITLDEYGNFSIINEISENKTNNKMISSDLGSHVGLGVDIINSILSLHKIKSQTIIENNQYLFSCKFYNNDIQ